MLVHNGNFLNCRLILLIAGQLWEEQGFLAKNVRTPDETRVRMCCLALGAGSAFLMRLLKRTVTDAAELARIGLKATIDAKPQDFGPEADGTLWAETPGVRAEQISARLMSLLLYTLEARFWSCAGNEETIPGLLAGLCSDCLEHRNFVYQKARAMWEAATKYESSARHPAMSALRAEIYWLSWPASQWRLRLLAHFHFQDNEQMLRYFKRLFTRVGDTKCIEDSHKVARRPWTNMFGHIVSVET